MDAITNIDSREAAKDAKESHIEELPCLRLLHLPLDVLTHFVVATFRAGCKRIANNHPAFASSRLRVNRIK